MKRTLPKTKVLENKYKRYDLNNIVFVLYILKEWLDIDNIYR